MKQITAYEAEGKLFKTEQEAREYILDKKLRMHFTNMDSYAVLRKMVSYKETRDFLIEAFKECDHPEPDSSEIANDDILTQKLDHERIEAIKGLLRAFIGIGDYNYPGNPAYGDGFVLKDIQSKYSPAEIEEARRQLREEEK